MPAKDENEIIVGREKEQELLGELLKSKKAEFIAVYGRRRVGKTFLIKNFVSRFPCIFFHVTGIQNGTLKEQIEEFSEQLVETFFRGAPSPAQRKRWRDVFKDLNEAILKLPKDKKVVLFLDEFPWMVTRRSKLLRAVELYWNRYWVFDRRVKLIICGSATSWIVENIINNKGGLHNRVTRTIQLVPFSLSETEHYLKEHKITLSQRQILDLYTALGGVPLYWTFLRRGRSAHQSIDELCFERDGALVKEFDRLFQSLFKDSKPYIDLIRIIAKHRYGINQFKLIVEARLPDGGNTVRRLNQLEEAGFITSLVPYGHKDKGIYYVIDDEYCLFYLSWIEPNRRAIAKKSANTGFWLAQSQRPAWKTWAGYAFESICYKHISQIQRALKICPGSIATTWRFTPRSIEEEGAQIDLLFDRPDGSITLCEIKCSEKPFVINKAYAQALLHKQEIFQQKTKTEKQIFWAFITPHGLKPTLHSEELISAQATLKDLFKT
jgi:uncharacterized protein